MTTLYHGACYYPELWPESDLERDIAGIKAAGLNVVRVADFAWSYLEPDPGRISVDFFIRVLDRLHTAGIHAIVCTPTASPPVWLTHGHPERCFVDAEGRVMSHGARQHASYEHPAVRAACFRIVEALGRALGRHPALLAWQIDNEFKCHVGEDFSAAAIAHWHRWLKKRFGTVAALNAAWGTDVWSHRYRRFDQVPAPVRTPFLHTASLSTAYRMFSRESIANFMDEQAAILRRHSSVPITHNLAPAFSVNLERMAANLDFVSFDDYPDRSRWDTIIFDHDLFRTAKPGRAHWVMETSCAHNGWLGQHDVIHPPGFLAAEAVASYALGAEAFCYWLWRQHRTGAELPHSALLHAWGQPSIGYAEVKRVDLARRKLESLLADTRPAPAEVAITWSDLGRAMHQTEPLGASRLHVVDYHQTIARWHRLVLDAGLHRDIRFESAALDGLKLLLTPAMPYVSPEFLARVEAFVRAGGIWICGPGTGCRAVEHSLPTTSALGALEALAGVETVFSFPITGTDATGRAFAREAPLAGWCFALRPVDKKTKILGTLRSEHAPGLAFVTERNVGRGRVVMIGASPEGAAGHKLLSRLIAHYTRAAGLKPFRVSLGTVVCPRRNAEGSAPAIVVNLDGRGGWVKTGRGRTLKLGAYDWRTCVL